MSCVLKIISPAANSTVKAGAAAVIVAEVHGEGLLDNLWNMGVSAKASIHDPNGHVVKMGTGKFSGGNCHVDLTWPTTPGPYKCQVQAIGELGFDNAVDTVDFTVQ